MGREQDFFGGENSCSVAASRQSAAVFLVGRASPRAESFFLRAAIRKNAAEWKSSLRRSAEPLATPRSINQHQHRCGRNFNAKAQRRKAARSISSFHLDYEHEDDDEDDWVGLQVWLSFEVRRFLPSPKTISPCPALRSSRDKWGMGVRQALFPMPTLGAPLSGAVSFPTPFSTASGVFGLVAGPSSALRPLDFE